MNSERPTATLRPCVGVFDSGVGGLSVLQALRQVMPAASLTYFADSAHAPYGEQETSFVVERSRAIAAALIEQGAVALVVACNTATALALEALRAEWPALPIIGVEPGVKPAVALSRRRRVAVMATEHTLQSQRFRRLVERHSVECEVIALPCPGLAALIERGDLNAAAVRDHVEALCAPLHGHGVDVVVLGCTHYPFVRHHIEAALGGGVAIVDTAEAVARQTAARCSGVTGSAEPALTRLSGSGDITLLGSLAAQWLPFACTVGNERGVRSSMLTV